MNLDNLKENVKCYGFHSYVDEEEKEDTIKNTLKVIKKTLEGLKPGEVFSYTVKEEKPTSLKEIIDVTKI